MAVEVIKKALPEGCILVEVLAMFQNDQIEESLGRLKGHHVAPHTVIALNFSLGQIHQFCQA